MAEVDLRGAVGADDEPVADKTEEQVDWEAKNVELQEKLDAADAALKAQAVDGDRNLRRQSSSLQNQINEAKVRADNVESSWADRFHAEKMSGMEEGEALRYENSLLADELDQSRTETAEVRQAADNARSAAGWVQHFQTLGINADRLNTQGSLQNLADSGYQAEREDRAARTAKYDEMTTKVESLTATVTALNAGEPDPNAIAKAQGDLEPPQVAIGQGQAQTGSRTMVQALEAAKQYFGGVEPTEEMLYRAVETKQLPASVLPGLEGMPPEDKPQR